MKAVKTYRFGSDAEEGADYLTAKVIAYNVTESCGTRSTSNHAETEGEIELEEPDKNLHKVRRTSLPQRSRNNRFAAAAGFLAFHEKKF